MVRGQLLIHTKDVRGAWERETFRRLKFKGEPKRSEVPREQRPRPGVKFWVARRGTAHVMGGSRWSAGSKPGGLLGKRQSGRVVGDDKLDHEMGEKLRREKPKSVRS